MAKAKEKPPVCGDCERYLLRMYLCDWRSPIPLPSWWEPQFALARHRAPEHTAEGCPTFKRRDAACCASD